MSDDKILDEYLKGRSAHSALYRKASEGERCPDELAARILGEAQHGSHPRSTGGRVESLRRRFRGSYDRHRIWVGTILPMILAVALVLGFQMVIGNGTQTDLECRGTSAGQSAERSSYPPDP